MQLLFNYFNTWLKTVNFWINITVMKSWEVSIFTTMPDGLCKIEKLNSPKHNRIDPNLNILAPIRACSDPKYW